MSPTRDQAPIRLVIADDRRRTRRALGALLATEPGFEVVGEAADSEKAVASVERLRPDRVLIDILLPRLDGIADIARIKARWPSVRVVCHSLAAEGREEALAAGADAFVCKGAATAELLGALRPRADVP